MPSFEKNCLWQWQRWAKSPRNRNKYIGIFARFVLSLTYYFKSYMCIQCFEITSTSLKSLVKTLVLVCSEIIYLQKKPFQCFLLKRCYRKVHSYLLCIPTKTLFGRRTGWQIINTVISKKRSVYWPFYRCNIYRIR